MYLETFTECPKYSAARLIHLTSRYEHVTPLLIQLHWLPIEQRITFKIAVITTIANNPRMVHGSNSSLLQLYNELRLRLLKAKRKIQITKEYKWLLWNDENTGNGKKLSENTYKRCVTRKLNGQKVRWLTRLDEKTAMMLPWTLKRNELE